MEGLTLIRYLKGTLDTESCKDVENWISLSEKNRKILEDLYVVMFVNNRIMAKEEIDVNKAFNQFLKQKKLLPPSYHKRKTVQLWRKAAAVAAISIVVLLSGALTTIALLEKNSQSLVVSTKLGERAQVNLPDGSTVWLNACSKLEYRKSFFSSKRKARLTGEAYFSVAHHNRFPFVVMNNGSEVKVLGTKFNLKCNDDEKYLAASLTEGSIQFSDENLTSSIKLKPNEKLIFDKQTHRINIERIVSQEDVTAWISGRLLFENNSLEEIASVLEKHYNIHIRFNDENAKEIRFTAEFEMADNIYQILSILEITDKFTYQIDNKNITISSK